MSTESDPKPPAPPTRVIPYRDQPLGTLVVFLLLLGAMFAGAIASARYSPTLCWASVFASMVVCVTYIGRSVTGVWRGAYINPATRRVSLSQVQMIAWTVLVISALLSICYTNLIEGHGSPLSIDVPASLWVLLGISTVSTVVSPAITEKKLKEGAEKVASHDDPQQAAWSDMLLSDVQGAGPSVDIGKLQMFLFTFVLVLGYGGAIWNLLEKGGSIDALPAVDDGINVLLGVSHTGYLANKQVQQTTAPKPAKSEA